jgi:hypothetical protein
VAFFSWLEHALAEKLCDELNATCNDYKSQLGKFPSQLPDAKRVSPSTTNLGGDLKRDVGQRWRSSLAWLR